MVNNNQSVLIKLKPESLRDIEIFVDTICDQLFINDTYYGNILMALTELFNYLVDNNYDNNINITYNSDYKNIVILFQPVDYQTNTKLTGVVNIDEIIHQENNKTIFLLHSLVDNISMVKDDTLSLEFDISALHNEIYNERAALMRKYFSIQSKKEAQKQHD